MVSDQRSLLIHNNRRICIQMEQWVNRQLAPQGITAVQAQILMYILCHSDHGTSLTAIHQEFGYSMATLSGMMKRLREKGYVQIGHCAGDDRYKLLFGTEKGKEMGQYLQQAMCSLQSQLYAQFSQEELQILDRLQKKMLANLSDLISQRQKEVPKS